MYKKTVALPGRLDAYYSAKAAGSADRLESILYPSPLLTVKTRPLPEDMNMDLLQETSITTYTKHYYIGTERIASALGTMNNIGLLCENVWPGSQDIIDEMGDKTAVATEILIADYNIFEKELQLPEPYRYETYICTKLEHDAENYDAYWYHPDHLGSSSYITNLAGEVSQHMEYLPFGETLVEEHLNSYNSPYKFNAKEFDAETGWYYYGARYYNPKWSVWLSVDPLAEKFPHQSPYIFSNNNPINFIDPDGRAAISINKPFDWYENKQTGDVVWFDGSEFREGYRNLGSSTNLAVSSGNEFTNYGLNNDGSFSNLDTGEFYHKGESVRTVNGTRIVSNLNTMESAKSIASDIAAPFFELPQKIGAAVINQVNIGINEGVHEGGAYNGENVVIHQTYELNNWRIEPSARSATATGRPTWEEGKEMIRNTISVVPVGVTTGLGKTPVQEFVIDKSVTAGIKTILKKIFE